MGIRCQSDWVSAVSDAQLFDDLFELVLSRELPEPPHSLLFSWCTVTSISDTCIVTVSVCVVSVFFLLGAWQSGKKGRKKEKGFVVILPVILYFFFNGGFIPHWKGVCHPIIVSGVPTCVVGIVFFFFFHPSELNCSAAGFIPNMASNAFPLFFFSWFLFGCCCCFLLSEKNNRNVCVTLTLDLAPNDIAGTKKCT